MSAYSFGFEIDTTEVDESAPALVDRSPIPPGAYVAHVIDSTVKDTKAGTGKYVALTWEVLEGQHAGRRIFQNCNIINPNPTAESIGRRVLKAIAAAAGVERVNSSDLLHHKPMNVKVKVRPSGPDRQGIHREAQNEMDEAGFSAIQRRAPARPSPAPVPQRPAMPPQRPAMPPQRPAAPAGARPVTPPWMAQKAAPAEASDFPGDHVSEDEIPY